MLVNIPKIKTKTPRSFTIIEEYHTIVKRYETLRPKTATTTRFFKKYAKGKCTAQPIGINTFRNFPKEIATELKLPDSKLYTGNYKN